MTLDSLLLHPASLVVYQVLVTALLISFTKPSSLVRPAALPFLAAATHLIVLKCLKDIARLSVASILAGNGPTYLLRYLDLALLSRWSYEAGGPTSPSASQREVRRKTAVDSDGVGGRSGPSGRFSDRLRFGLVATLSSRHVDTAWEVKNVPRFSPDRPRYVPSLPAYLRQSAFAALVCYLVVDLFGLDVRPERNAVLFAPQNVAFFARTGSLTAEQLAVRLVSSLTVWISIYCVSRMGYSLLALVAVGTGLNTVSAWQPMFG